MSLIFSYQNSKLNALAKHLDLRKRDVLGFDIPAGYTCPCAKDCKVYCNPVTGLAVKGKDNKFNCYASMLECRYPNVRKAHWDNYNQLRQAGNESAMTQLILNSLPESTKIVRIHSSGDFFSREYYNSWVYVSWSRPNTIFFAYTKVLEYVTNQANINAQSKDGSSSKPNFFMVYSHGGINDDFAEFTDIPTCYVRTNESEYPDIDTVCTDKSRSHEDFFKIIEQKSFCINLH